MAVCACAELVISNDAIANIMALTCTGVPWFPVGSGNTRYLIIEIVAAKKFNLFLSLTRKGYTKASMVSNYPVPCPLLEVIAAFAARKSTASFSCRCKCDWNSRAGGFYISVDKDYLHHWTIKTRRIGPINRFRFCPNCKTKPCKPAGLCFAWTFYSKGLYLTVSYQNLWLFNRPTYRYKTY
ncbi:MAG: hypothetical protein JWQ85_3782 [Mucilaginibacter sp.]|nr:hypothetical protein [Mucilaginibacter sp.]